MNLNSTPGNSYFISCLWDISCCDEIISKFPFYHPQYNEQKYSIAYFRFKFGDTTELDSCYSGTNTAKFMHEGKISTCIKQQSKE